MNAVFLMQPLTQLLRQGRVKAAPVLIPVALFLGLGHLARLLLELLLVEPLLTPLLTEPLLQSGGVSVKRKGITRRRLIATPLSLPTGAPAEKRTSSASRLCPCIGTWPCLLQLATNTRECSNVLHIRGGFTRVASASTWPRTSF